MQRLQHAIEFATNAHKGQKRKFGDEIEYISHPLAVMALVTKYKKSKNIKELEIAAVLHDVIEDTNATIEQIREGFGDMVADIVLELTTDEKLKQKYGKKLYMAFKVLTMTSYALNIKLADRKHNCSDLWTAHIDFKYKYTDETLYFLQILLELRKTTKSQNRLIHVILGTLHSTFITNPQYTIEIKRLMDMNDTIRFNVWGEHNG